MEIYYPKECEDCLWISRESFFFLLRKQNTSARFFVSLSGVTTEPYIAKVKSFTEIFSFGLLH